MARLVITEGAVRCEVSLFGLGELDGLRGQGIETSFFFDYNAACNCDLSYVVNL
jgi:hypothetical protein